MATPISYLALVGHGTDGSDGLKKGIHLRWQFARELGFPLGGFRLFRRKARYLKPTRCYAWDEFSGAVLAGPVDLGKTPPIRVSASKYPLPVVSVKALEDPSELGGTADKGMAMRPSRSVIRKQERGLRMTSASLTLTFPEPLSQVTLKVQGRPNSSVRLIGSLDNAPVADSSFALPDSTTHIIGLRAAAMNRLVVSVMPILRLEVLSEVVLLQVCVKPVEDCEEQAGWAPLAKPIVLPVDYPGNPSSEFRDARDNVREMTARLPRDPTVLARYGGKKAKGLIDVLKTLVDAKDPRPQGQRPVQGTTLSSDCPTAPASQQPQINFPALDAVLMACLDPMVAREVGLYLVDDQVKPGVAYDYKLAGSWRSSSLWNLPRRLDFEKLAVDWVFDKNLFPLGPGLTIRTVFQPRVVKHRSAFAETRNALLFSASQAAWNLPPGFGGTTSGTSRFVVEIVFQIPVGEFQAYVAHRGSPVTAEGWSGAKKVTASIVVQQNEGVAALQPVDPADRISRVVLKSQEFYLHWLAWYENRIPHGTHCTIAYGLVVTQPVPLAPPQEVTAVALPGLVKKEANCDPALEGETVDARAAAGVRWQLPLETPLLPANQVPLRYDLDRTDSNGTVKKLTDDGPVLPLQSLRATYRMPKEWRSQASLFVDWGLEPRHTYTYRVAGIDIFGRTSLWSQPTSPISAAPPPPATPAFARARYIDRQDPLVLSTVTQDLPAGVTEAILVEWDWPEDLRRFSWSIDGFEVRYSAGRPNIAPCVVAQVGTPNNLDWPVTLEISGIAVIPQDALAGRLLVQFGAAFRILSHEAGTPTGAKLRVRAVLALPPSTSRSAPVPGEASIPFDAEVPVDCILHLGQQSPNATLLSTHLRAGHASLSGGILSVGRLQIPIGEVVSSQQAGPSLRAAVKFDAAAFIQQGADLFDSKEVARLTELARTQFVTKLKLPPPPIPEYKDYGGYASWPAVLAASIPDVGTGPYWLLLWAQAGTTVPVVTPLGGGKFTAVVPALPADLAGDEPPRKTGAVAVCSQRGTGASQQRSVMSAPAIIEKVSHLPPPPPAFSSSLGPDGDLEPILASLPNFAGKSKAVLTWPGGAHTYEIYRALDETLFRVAHVDPASFDSLAQKNMALQALASRSENAEAFTRLDYPPEKLAANSVGITRFTDDSLEGRGKARYFYRVRAVDRVGNRSALGPSSPPVLVHGIPRPAPPAMTGVDLPDGSVTLRWAPGLESGLVEYRVYRSEDEFAASDVRLMRLLATVALHPAPDSAGPLPAEMNWTDVDVVGGRRYFYRLVTKAQDFESAPSPILSIQAVDARPPLSPIWIESTWSLLRDADQGEEPWPTDNMIPSGRKPAVRLKWKSKVSAPRFLLTRRTRGEAVWVPVPLDQLVPESVEESFLAHDRSALPVESYTYALWVISLPGVKSLEPSTRELGSQS